MTMMISPEGYIEELKGKTYKELLKERDDLLKEIQKFENDDIPDEEYNIDPSPEVVYQCNLLYLGELFKLISEKYNKEIIWGNEYE